MALSAKPTPEQDPTAGWTRRDEAVMAPVLSRMTDVVAASAQGSWITTVDGRRLLDFTCGIAVCNIGHCHPAVVSAIERQARTLIHTSVVARSPAPIELAEKLCSLTPFLDDPRVFFCNSGAEAVDGALKLARRATGRPGVIAFRGGFHGRTLAATSLTTAKGRYREGYEPLLPGVYIAPYAEPLRTSAVDALAALDDMLVQQAPPGSIGAVVVEPVLGEGGYVVPPVGWLRGLRERCDEHGILLVFDEVQTGAGRTGRYFAAETIGVAPDVVLFAKGVASGLPLGGIIAGRALMDRWPPAAHGSTFGGNPVACAAASATIDVLLEGRVMERVAVRGPEIIASITTATADNQAVVDVRGLGYMIGVELATADQASQVKQSCLDEGMLVLSCGPRDSVIRLIPPLNASDDELEHGLSIFTKALTGAGSRTERTRIRPAGA